MPRPREFDVDDALECAMQMFWSKGYEATSLQDLTRAMGLSKSSFYCAFGSKHELFLSAIDRYRETVTTRGTCSVIERTGGGKAGIEAAFRHHLEAIAGGELRRGCFLNNCAVEMSPRDGECAKRVAAGLVSLEEAFFRAVIDGQRRGEIPTRHDARGLAGFLTSSLHGMIVTAKGGSGAEMLDDVLAIVMSTLD